MQTISLPKTTYETLVKKAKFTEQILEFLQKKYPVELYADKRIAELRKNDKVSPKLRKEILSLIKKSD